MSGLLLIGLIGLCAQLTAGSLGMGYGVLATSGLLAVGVGPVVASATVHFAEIGSSAALGFAHWRLRNIHWGLVLRLAGPGAVGAFCGALLLAHAPVALAGAAVALVLAAVGAYLLVRFAVRVPRAVPERRSMHSTWTLALLGLFGGVVDSTGGGWGPVTATALLASGRIEPRAVVGSIGASKLLVSAGAALGFLIALGAHGVPLRYVLVLAGSGMLAAPMAALIVRRLPQNILGAAVGGLLVLSNLRGLTPALGPAAHHLAPLYLACAGVAAGFVTLAIIRHRRGAGAELPAPAGKP